MEKERENEILPKILDMKEIISEKIKTFEDYNTNKATLLSLINQIESLLNPAFNNNNQEIQKKIEPQENIIDKEIIKEDSINEKNNNNLDNIENNKKEEENEAIEENNDINNNNYNQEEEESERHSLPKLNFDYDKNINEILNNINIQGQNEINEIDNKQIIIKNEMTQEKNKKITNVQNNGYSNLFSFNQDLSSTEDFTTKKTRIYNSNINEKDNISNNNILNENNININNINDNSIHSEENIYKNNSIHYENNEPEKDQNKNNNLNNQNNSKALRVADILMKLNSNDILYDIISQLYSKEILEQLMSPNVDINLINIIEQTIEKITILENEEIQKLKNKESSIISNPRNENDILNNNINNNKEYNEIKDKDEYLYNELNKKNNNNYNRLNNIPKKVSEYKKYKSSSSFYDKNKNNSISSISSMHYQNYPPKNKKISSKNKLKEGGVHLNSEILQNYPKTGKTILGYEKFKRDKNKEFNFERSLRNDNYEENVLNKRNSNLNISKADSIKNHSYYSINGNNRSMSNKKMIFNNYTSPFGDYFDSSLQKGGESKLIYYNNKKRGIFKNARSPVKDYIDGLNDVYI